MQPPARVTKPLSFAGEIASVRDIVIAPMRAIATIGESAPWRVAYLIAAIFTVAAKVIIGPALWNVTLATDPAAATLTRDQLAVAAQQTAFINGFEGVIEPLVVAGIFALGMAVATPRTILEGRRLATFFSLAMTASAPVAIAEMLCFLCTLSHPASSYTKLVQLVQWPPVTLASFVPHGQETEVEFLSNVDIFSLASYVVIAYGYAALTGSSLNRSLVISFACAFAVTIRVLFGW